MILIENQEILRNNSRFFGMQLKITNQIKDQSVTLEEGKWLAHTGGGARRKKNYLHSKYDPVQEAERFVAQLEGGGYQHVFLRGWSGLSC